MIRVSVFLRSAISRDRDRELARMDIWNDGEQTVQNDRMGTYHAHTLRGRSSEALDKGVPSKRASIGNWPRHDLHIWNLVRLLLETMGYTATRASVSPRPGVEAVPQLAGYRRAHMGGWIYTADPSSAPGEDWEPLYAFTNGE
jgi:hypothetical protein